jgi:NitT/TauT family transport system substrate-binding protein
VIDTISVRAGLIENESLWMQKFHQVWQRALDFAASDPEEALKIMAKREGISVVEFSEALTGLTIIASDKQTEVLGSQRLKDNIKDVCNILKRSNGISFECDNINLLVQGMVSSQ